jgi:ankyrin repeat protein
MGAPAVAEDNQYKLYAAIRADNLKDLKALLDQGVSPDTPDSRQITPLMWAAEIGSIDAMRILIAGGATVNAQNAFGATALMWSVADPDKVRLLLEHGADINKVANSGRTALMLAAFINPSAQVVRMLLAKGADVAVIDRRNFTPLYAATFGNDTATIQMLVEAGAELNRADDFIGFTPLLNAAGNGNLEAVKVLLAKGAKVNVASKRENLPQVNVGTVAFGGFTPLMTAAPYAPPEVVKALLDAGAEVNVADYRGFTPLMLSIATDRHNPKTTQLLLDHGADPMPKILNGETLSYWLDLHGSAPVVTSSVAAKPLNALNAIDNRAAVQRSVLLLEKASAEFFTKAACFACHEQLPADIAVTAARAKGIPVNEQAAKERRLQIASTMNSPGPSMTEGSLPMGGADNNLYAAESLVRTGYTPDRITDLLAAYLASHQQADGSWRLGGYSRAPMQDSTFSRTAMGLRALKAYATPGRAAEMKERIERAKQWLLRAEPVILEDYDMRLAGVAAVGTDRATLERLAQPILSRQLPDGGWAQRDGSSSDAYATGMTLTLLAEAAALRPDQVAYQKGVHFLLSTQRLDGSWHVHSRATRFQPYFQSGFPYEHDQWISTMATGWATNALALAIGASPRLNASSSTPRN